MCPTDTQNRQAYRHIDRHTHRQTDHAASVTIGRILIFHVKNAIRPNNTKYFLTSDKIVSMPTAA